MAEDEPPDASTTDGSSSGDPIAFIEMPDASGPAFECSLSLEDCPPGLKCMPWANDGGSAWNATRCSPVAEDAAEPGEPCVVEGSAVSGLDNCELHAICWYVDPQTNEGTCIAMCNTANGGAFCEDPDFYCSSGSVLSLCFATCSPLLQDCLPGEACYPLQEDFVCHADASGKCGAAGERCEFVNVCDPGTACLNPDLVPGCELDPGCCSSYCHLDDPTPPCLDGQSCLPWYDDPSDAEEASIGVCALPWE